MHTSLSQMNPKTTFLRNILRLTHQLMSGDRHENSKPVQIPVRIQNHLTLLLQLRKK